jgi:Acetyltransferase (GNAT) domain
VLKFHLIDYDRAPWQLLDQFEDRNVFQLQQWIAFLADTQNATPVLAELRDGTSSLGFFTGLVFRRMGMRILGSSFPGWTTPYIGFNLCPGVLRIDALRALETFAFGELNCMHLEICDRQFAPEDGKGQGFTCDWYQSYETDLTLSEEQLFNQMDSACRRCIRKAEKSGLQIEQASDMKFADEYFEQLKDVFAKQNLVPTYGLDRVQKLIEHLLPTGQLLLLRARDAQGNCIGTGIYPGFNKVASFWGNASFRSSQNLRPNESLHWYAMRYWKKRGARIFDWGGGGEYKEKYGVRPISIPWFRKSRYGFIETLRQGAKGIFEWKQQVLGKLKRSPKEPSKIKSAEVAGE